MSFADQVQEPHLRALLQEFFVRDEAFIKAFKFHSAAKSVHHSFVGGLLEHTLSVYMSQKLSLVGVIIFREIRQLVNLADIVAHSRRK